MTAPIPPDESIAYADFIALRDKKDAEITRLRALLAESKKIEMPRWCRDGHALVGFVVENCPVCGRSV